MSAASQRFDTLRLWGVCGKISLMKGRCKRDVETTSPVSYVASVELKLVIVSQQPLLNAIEIHRVAVDDYEPHAPLEVRSQVLTVLSGTSWKGKDTWFNE